MKLFVTSEEQEIFDVIFALKEADSNDMKLSIYSYNSTKLKNTIHKRYGVYS